MPFDPDRHHRRSIRLQGYDYAQPGAYFVTICTQGRVCLFGRVLDGRMVLNDAGLAAKVCWHEIPEHFPFVERDAYVVMPNHVHGIIVITPGTGDDGPNDGSNVGPNDGSNVGPNDGRNVGANDGRNVGANDGRNVANDHSPLPPLRSPSKTVGSIVRGYKIGVTKWFRANTDVHTVWQRNYYEHVIRDEESLDRIRSYIENNPARCATDRVYPPASARLGGDRRPR